MDRHRQPARALFDLDFCATWGADFDVDGAAAAAADPELDDAPADTSAAAAAWWCGYRESPSGFMVSEVAIVAVRRARRCLAIPEPRHKSGFRFRCIDPIGH